jgi:hypothetical protein
MIAGDFAFALNTGVVFNFYAAVGSTVTETISGLEDFTNHFVGGYYDQNHAPITLGNRSYTRSEAYDLPLNERLGKVLPAVCGIGRPTEEPWWPTLRRV